MTRLLAHLLLAGCAASARPIAATSATPAPATAPAPVTTRAHGPRQVVTETEIQLYDTIQFVGNTAEIAEVSSAILDAIAATLRGNPSILLLEVRGHSDWEEPDRVKRAELSIQRAEHVVTALVARGVERARLSAYGASDSEPVSTTDAVANRRIELVIRERVSD